MSWARPGSHFRHRVLVQLVLIFAVSLGAQSTGDAATPPKSDPTWEIFELSAMRPQLELVGYQLDQWVLAQSANMSPMHLTVLRTEIARQYSAASLEAEIIPRMRARLQRAYAGKAVAWLRSPLGMRINLRDTEAASPESAERMQIYLEGLQQNPAPPERKQLIDRLIAAIRYTEVTVDMGLSLMRGLVLGMQATAPPERRADPELVDSQIASTRAGALAEARAQSEASLLYTYRALSIADLTGLVEFAESDAGRWYYDTVWKSSQEALDAAALKLQKQVGAEIARLDAARSP